MVEHDSDAKWQEWEIQLANEFKEREFDKLIHTKVFREKIVRCILITVTVALLNLAGILYLISIHM